jgi:hypothetical protein
MAAKKRPPFNMNSVVRGSIRRTFARSPIVVEVRMAGRREVPKYNKDGSLAKKPAVQYHCEVCLNWVSSTKIAIDHKIPVIGSDGFVDWNTFVDRLYCSKENLQRICEDCHQKKTNQERFERDYKKDLETLQVIGTSIVKYGPDLEVIKIFTKKFTSKKLENYPPEFVEEILKLKSLIGKPKRR